MFETPRSTRFRTTTCSRDFSCLCKERHFLPVCVSTECVSQSLAKTVIFLHTTVAVFAVGLSCKRCTVASYTQVAEKAGSKLPEHRGPMTRVYPSSSFFPQCLSFTLTQFAKQCFAGHLRNTLHSRWVRATSFPRSIRILWCLQAKKSKLGDPTE